MDNYFQYEVQMRVRRYPLSSELWVMVNSQWGGLVIHGNLMHRLLMDFFSPIKGLRKLQFPRTQCDTKKQTTTLEKKCQIYLPSIVYLPNMIEAKDVSFLPSCFLSFLPSFLPASFPSLLPSFLIFSLFFYRKLESWRGFEGNMLCEGRKITQ